MNIILVACVVLGAVTLSAANFQYCSFRPNPKGLHLADRSKGDVDRLGRVKVGKKCYFQCPHGYRPAGDGYSQCYNYGWWPPLPKCVKKQYCDVRFAPEDGYVSPLASFYPIGKEIKFKCRRGYRLEGDEKDLCTKAAEWLINNTPKCEKVKCAKRDAPDNGDVNPKKPYYGLDDVITFSCDDEDKYVLVGTKRDKCTISNKWLVGKTPECKIICPGRMAPENGFVSPKQDYFFEGGKVKFQCKDGYRLEGSERDVCQGDGTWRNINDPPRCVLITCPNRMPPTNGKVKYSDVPIVPGVALRFGCDDGYRLKGKSGDVCEEDGTWKLNKTPMCELIVCPSRDAPDDGTVKYSDDAPFEPGTKLKFDCDDGYRLIGEEDDVCTKSGTWKINRTPRCKLITCSQRAAPDKGTVDQNNPNLPTQTITFDCISGYRLVGEKMDTCQDDGSWDINETPRCVLITCSPRDAPGNGAVRYSTRPPFVPGTKVRFTCNKGYRLQGEDNDVCESDGTWERDQTPTCELIICPQRDAPENGEIADGEKDPYVPGDKIRFDCIEGYRLNGRDKDVCGDDGSWVINMPPTCELITCRQRSAPEFGSVGPIKDEYLPTDIIQFDCDDGYRLSGKPKDRCEKDGSWAVNLTPDCILIECSPRKVPDNGYYTTVPENTPYLPGTKLTYFCNKGYNLVGGHPFDKCTATGKWQEPRQPFCVEKTYKCRRRNPPHNGYIKFDGPKKYEYDEGDKITFHCDKPYVINEVAYDVCMKNGKWANAAKGKYPDCVMMPGY